MSSFDAYFRDLNDEDKNIEYILQGDKFICFMNTRFICKTFSYDMIECGINDINNIENQDYVLVRRIFGVNDSHLIITRVKYILFHIPSRMPIIQTKLEIDGSFMELKRSNSSFNSNISNSSFVVDHDEVSLYQIDDPNFKRPYSINNCFLNGKNIKETRIILPTSSKNINKIINFVTPLLLFMCRDLLRI